MVVEMDTQYYEAIEAAYGVQIAEVVAGPRQFVAETFVVTVAGGQQYFCKITDKPTFIREVIAGLPALQAIEQLGFDRLNYPLPTTTGELYVMVGKVLVVLYTFIDAPQSYQYELEVFGRLTGEIHQLTTQVIVPIPKVDFTFGHQERFESVFGARREKTGDVVLAGLRRLLCRHEDMLSHYYSLYKDVAEACRKASFDFVVTHGDAPGNVLVRSPEDIYIVDWDGLMLAPAERDLWFLDMRSEFLEGYRLIYPQYERNELAWRFSILDYRFNSIVHYLNEIVPAFDEVYRQTYLDKFVMDLDEEQGWIYPYLQRLG